ncbi:MAG: glycosyltransferase [Burkholderiales bacterium]|nr:glycosyltransferase [Burkholderiales bacterium]
MEQELHPFQFPYCAADDEIDDEMSSKIIAFPQNRANARRAKVESRARIGNRPMSYGRSPADMRKSASHAGSITPIWASRGHGILVSVVIPTGGRPHLLNRCLAALSHQAFDPTRFEIIVVDDVPQSATHEVVERWASQAAVTGPRVYYLPVDGTHGPAAARNLGWHAARGAMVAFTEDSAIPYRDWLTNGVRAFDGVSQAAWGRIVTPLTDPPTEHELGAKRLEEAEFLATNCFCLRRTLENLDGFDERFQCGWRDDSDLYFRLLQADVSVAYAPGAVVERPPTPAEWGISMRQQKNILFDALLYKKHPALYREKISASARWDYYAIVACLLVLATAFFTADPLLMPIAAGLWLLLTGRFFLHRIRHTAKTVSHLFEMMVTSLLIPPLAVFWRLAGAVRFRVGFI